jgi:3-oxoacyl-[acyl-carrier-protein] synthase-1
MSVNRAGINIGEGAAVFLLSRQAEGVEFLGAGESSDAYHISAPDPTGHGAELALRNALKQAGLHPSELGYVNLHGTGTPKNDSMEAQLCHRLFEGQVPLSSTKPWIGHTLGAAGAQEAALCFLALSPLNTERRLPPHLWDGAQDPALPVLPLVSGPEKLKAPICMSNSFAFGGNNVSLIFKAVNGAFL